MHRTPLDYLLPAYGAFLCVMGMEFCPLLGQSWISQCSSVPSKLGDELEGSGKGMIVCMSRDICVHLYNEIVKLRPEWHNAACQRGV